MNCGLKTGFLCMSNIVGLLVQFGMLRSQTKTWDTKGFQEPVRPNTLITYPECLMTSPSGVCQSCPRDLSPLLTSRLMSMLGHAAHHNSLTLPGMATMLVHNGAANPGKREKTKDQLSRLGSLWLKAKASNAACTEICERSSSSSVRVLHTSVSGSLSTLEDKLPKKARCKNCKGRPHWINGLKKCFYRL